MTELENAEVAEPEEKELFSVVAEAQGQEQTLIVNNLTFPRLIDDIVFPYENGETFFIDGAPLSREKITKLKIVRQKKGFSSTFSELHWRMRRSNHQTQKLYGDQYHIRLEAILREGGEDVTSQVVKAFNNVIKPSIKDYLPKREELIEIASKFFWEGIKALSKT